MSATPHDALFKHVFSQPDHVRGLLRTALPPEVAKHIDWSSLCLASGSFVSDALRQQHSDLLFQVQLREEPALLYLVLEHKSVPDRWTVYQVLGYVLEIWDRQRRQQPRAARLPPVFAIVVHHGAQRWTGPCDLVDLIDLDDETRRIFAPYMVQFRIIVDDLSSQDDAALRARALSSLAGLTLFCLARARLADDLVLELRRWVDAFRGVFASPTGAAALAGVLSYIMEVADVPVPELREFLTVEVGDEDDTIMTTAERLREEGRAQGRAEGRTEGRAEGRAEMLLKLLVRRFGVADSGIEAQVRSATTAQLDTWAERLLTAQSLADVFDDA